MAGTKQTLNFANQSINEIRKDILLQGANAQGYLIVNKDNGNIIDYMPCNFKDEIFPGEEKIQMSLFNILCVYIQSTKFLVYEKEFSNTSVWVTAFRVVLDVSEKDFAKMLNCSEIAVRSWETDKRLPKMNILIKLANEKNIPIDFIIDGFSIGTKI